MPKLQVWLAGVGVAASVAAASAVVTSRFAGSSTNGPAMAAIGEPIPAKSGLLIVDLLTELDDPMAMMHDMNSKGFAASGMSMSAMSPDPIPAGMRRLRLDVRLTAESESMTTRASDFEIVDGMVPVGDAIPPRHTQLGDGVLPVGSTLAGLLEFEIPLAWTHPMLRFNGSDQLIHLPVETIDPAANHSDHDHSEPSDSSHPVAHEAGTG